MQLFGLRKTPDLSLAPRQALAALGTKRAQIQRRAAGESRPFAHSGKFCGHKSTKQAVKTIAQGRPVELGKPVVTTLVCFITLHARLRVQFAMPTWSSPQANRLDTPNTPAIRFARALNFEASLVHTCYGLSGCSPPLDGSD